MSQNDTDDDEIPKLALKIGAVLFVLWALVDGCNDRSRPVYHDPDETITYGELEEMFQPEYAPTKADRM